MTGESCYGLHMRHGETGPEGNEMTTTAATAYVHTDEHLRAREDKMTLRNLDDMLALPIHLRADAYAEAHYAMNMTPLRPSDALYQAIRTVRQHNGRPARS